ncbi:[FeFe] hydrogenase H-cluster radical SAM maturase HydE [Fusibacter tunisiensis]|uniref:Biotin synthase n=1 Tax=Fusibacter tunisiensis TaxID=1008308 RepID=A0ABS2MUD0_9FIRM|nr:[FeFe] hydrogenase H-cluster radical SAM maturase HydE [Fusibacter tunisiensis]MBM7563014.1 biotin synthase [Fusibacter tunisiensis]
MTNKARIDYLHRFRQLNDKDLTILIDTFSKEDLMYAKSIAMAIKESYYGRDIYIRGLIELTNYCQCNCLYCGIRSGNTKAERYRIMPDEVFKCCEKGYELGFRTFVIQGGEDPWYTDDKLVPMIQKIRNNYPDCAITLSLGERSRTSYEKLYDAGANRYLLRHETGDASHYRKLHSPGQELADRLTHLKILKSIGYQIGTGFMVGSPGQTPESLVKDLSILKELNPEMVGIGPFVPHHESVFKACPPGRVDLTQFMLALIRIMLPSALIPATTSLGTVDVKGREKGVLSGANVIMPNLSPMNVRNKYLLYDNKAYTGSEAAESLENLRKDMELIGHQVVVHRGDFIAIREGSI